MSKVRLIKALVLFMTIGIFAGLIFLMTVMAKNIASKKQSGFISENEISLQQPIGSTIKNVLIKDDNVYIVVSDGGKADRIVIYNTDVNSVMSTLSIN